MKPIDQQHPKGCFQAAVASVLELSLSEVPDFCAPGWNGNNWWGGFLSWCKARQLLPIEFRLRESEPCFAELPDGAICILSGRSNRGMIHSVVAETYDGNRFKIIHDPHPDRSGLFGFPKDVLFFVREGGW